MKHRDPSLSDIYPDFLIPLQVKYCAHRVPGLNLLGPVPVQPVDPADEDEGSTVALLAAAIEAAIPDDEEED
jgi:hypothetical protein